MARETETLLAEAAFVRRLAGALLRDQSLADDVSQEVLTTALATPEFLYLTQRASANPSDARSTGAQSTDHQSGQTMGRISDLELASRLAIFLWSSIPDDELLRLAEQGRLSEPEVLTAQVDRMLADPRSRRFTEQFVQQWLGMDGLDGWGAGLVAIQNGTRPQRVIQLTLNDARTAVRDVRTLAANIAEFGEPTLGVRVGDDYVFVANSYWPHLGQGPDLDPDQPRSRPTLLAVTPDRF